MKVRTLSLVFMCGEFPHIRIAFIALYRLAYAILAIFAREFFLPIAYCHMTSVERPVFLPVTILVTRNRALKPFLFEMEEQQQGSTSCQQDRVVT